MARSVFTAKVSRTNFYGVGIGLTLGVVGKSIFDRINGANKLEPGEQFEIESLPHAKDLKAKHGLPEPYPVLTYSNHVVCYDMARKTPRWVLEHLTRNTINGGADRKSCSFKRDANIPAIFSSRNGDYLKSGFSRGHMASAGKEAG